MVSTWSGLEKLTWKNGDYMHFDLNADPDEIDPQPLAEDHPLRGELSQFIGQVRDSVDNNKAEPTTEMIEALRKLGYLK